MIFLFFPAAGNCNDGSLNNTGVNGNFWSCALSSGDEVNAQNLNFNSGEVELNNNNRVLGLPVRPVGV